VPAAKVVTAVLLRVNPWEAEVIRVPRVCMLVPMMPVPAVPQAVASKYLVSPHSEAAVVPPEYDAGESSTLS